MTVPLTTARLRTAFNLPWLLCISGLVFLLSQTLLGLAFAPLGGPDTLLRIQLGFTSAEAYQAQFQAWDEAGLLGVYQAHFLLDALHPFWYAIFGTCALAVVFSWRGASAVWDRLLPLPMLSGLLDVMENSVQRVFLAEPLLITDGLARLSWLCSLGKWTLVMVYILAVLYWLLPLRR